MNPALTSFLYLVASVFFILSLRGLSSPTSARSGNNFGMIGMFIAVLTTVLQKNILSYDLILAGLLIGAFIGIFIAKKIEMTALPQLVAAFHSLVGLAAVCVAIAAYKTPDAFGITVNGSITTSALIEMSLGIIIGAITFTGSIVAFMKLQGILKSKPLSFPGQHLLNALIVVVIIGLTVHFTLHEGEMSLWLFTALALLLGFLLILPIGGADMPVIVSMLNSYSGWAACGIGFTLQNHLLIITGALVGASGAILSYIMCKGMNRSIINVVLGGFGGDSNTAGAASHDEDRQVKSGSAEDAAFLMKNADSVIIVPGYGMAVAQAQHALREMVEMLRKDGVKVRFAIHPVAGRMPGHMNVLLAEANIPYEDVLELEEINSDFGATDVVFVIGANDVTNPAAKTDPSSPIYGMPILDVENAKTVLFVKRSMAAGYAGVQNELFFRDNTMMLFGDAKKMCEKITKSLED